MPDGSLRPSFLLEVTMQDAITRLVSAGMKMEDAAEVVFWFTNYSSKSAMERYVMEYESGQRKRLANG